MGEKTVGIYVSIDSESVKELGGLIKDILYAEDCDQATKQAALVTVSESLKIRNVTIQGNSICQRETLPVVETEWEAV